MNNTTYSHTMYATKANAKRKLVKFLEANPSSSLEDYEILCQNDKWYFQRKAPDVVAVVGPEVITDPVVAEKLPVPEIVVTETEDKVAKVSKTPRLRTSSCPNPVEMVWGLANDEFAKAGNEMPKRKDVILACYRWGIAYNTASTQYQKWRTSKINRNNA